MRFPPVEDTPGIEDGSVDINDLDLEMREVVDDVSFAVTHTKKLVRRSRELTSTLDNLLQQHLYTHKSMRLILKCAYDEQDYTLVPDCASLVREQVEKIYQTALLLQGPHKWLRQYLRNAWQKDYERYLLEVDEYGHIDRHHDHIHVRFPKFLEDGRKLKLSEYDSVLVSDFAMKMVEYEWHHKKGTKPTPKPPWFTKRGSVGGYLKKYFFFPTPWDIMTKVNNKKLVMFLDRWYREYKMLSEYTHVLSGKITPAVAALDKSWKGQDKAKLYGEKKSQEFILMSNICAISICTVIMPYIGNGLGSKKTTKAYWDRLSKGSLFAKQLWNLYGRDTLT